MNQEKYRTQLEDQVKDLIAQYLQTHGEAPAVTIEWGKVQIQKSKLEPITNATLLPGSDEDLAAEVVARYWQQNGKNGRVTKLLREAFIDGALWMKKRIIENQPAHAAPEPEVVPPDNGRNVKVLLNTGKEYMGWYESLTYERWRIYYENGVNKFAEDLRPGDTVVSWKEID